MLTKRFLFIVVFSIASVLSFSQKNYRPGYIITHDFDTINGFINLRSNYQNSRSCEFKTENNSETKTYYPKEINGYKVENSKFYVTRDIDINNEKQTVFLEYLLDGIVDLFFLKELNGSYYFIEKEGTIYQLSNDDREVTIDNVKYIKKTNQYISVLNILFQESPKILDEIKNTPFSYKDLIVVTKDYHNTVCKDQKCIDYTKSTKMKIWIEPNAGVIFSWMGLTTSNNYAYNFSGFGGINVRFRPFISHDVWNIKTGISFFSNDFSGNFTNTLEAYLNYPLRIHTKYITGQIPLTLEYNFPERKIQPFFSLSYNNIFLLNTKYEIYVTNGNGTFSRSSAFRKYQMGLSFATGVRFNLNNSAYIYLKNEIAFRKSAANLNEILDYTRVYSEMINIGYGFSLKQK